MSNVSKVRHKRGLKAEEYCMKPEKPTVRYRDAALKPERYRGDASIHAMYFLYEGNCCGAVSLVLISFNHHVLCKEASF